jgi:hypothetical protein
MVYGFTFNQAYLEYYMVVQVLLRTQACCSEKTLVGEMSIVISWWRLRVQVDLDSKQRKLYAFVSFLSTNKLILYRNRKGLACLFSLIDRFIKACRELRPDLF